VSKSTIFDYARKAAEAEMRIIELLDKSLSDDLIETRSNEDLQKHARPRQGSDLRGS